MKAAGYLVRVDNLGRIVIPVRIRRAMDLHCDSCLELFTEEDRIIMSRYQAVCAFCGKDEDLKEYKGKHICAHCLEEINKN